MKLVAPLAPGRDQPNRFQHVEVLRDRLTGQAQVVLHGQPGAQLEQRLSVAFMQFVENGPTRRRRKRFEDIGHEGIIGKSRLACQVAPASYLPPRSVATAGSPKPYG